MTHVLKPTVSMLIRSQPTRTGIFVDRCDLVLKAIVRNASDALLGSIQLDGRWAMLKELTRMGSLDHNGRYQEVVREGIRL